MKTSAEVILTNVLMGLAGATNETAVQMSVRPPPFLLPLVQCAGPHPMSQWKAVHRC